MNMKRWSKQQTQTEDIILEFACSNVRKHRKCHTILVGVPVKIGTPDNKSKALPLGPASSVM
jgi:hypothetical protein